MDIIKSMKTRLCDIADIRSGHPFRGSITPDKDGDVYVAQVRDAQTTGEIFQDKMIKTSLTGKKHPDWLQAGDVLFVAKGAKHFSAIVENLPKKSVCSPHFFLIRLKTMFVGNVSPKFICWQLNQIPAQQYFKKSAEGSHYVSIRRQILEETPLNIPPLDRQQKIAALHNASINEQKILYQLAANRQQQINAIAMDLYQQT